ncbi:MAG: glycoside hydrolase family 19 protein [Bacteroidota bacterium]|nr:glycoside hydrolase family 19 protein [Bacteroidota bacterium]
MKTNLILLLLLIYVRSYSTGIADLISESQFNTMFPNRNAYATNAEFATNPANKALFSYANLINAAAAFPLFCNEGDINVRKRELAAFLANTSHETTGGWGGYIPGASDYVGRYTWGYCFPREFGYNPTITGQYCDSGSADYPPVAGQSYYGRGPVQISWNYNYGAFSQDVLGDKNILLSNPEKVLEDGTIFYQSSIWFWMTPQTGGWGLIYLKPSCHDVMVNAWIPTDPQRINNKLTPGFPVTINVINGGLESGPNRSDVNEPNDRLGFYLRYCDILGVDAVDAAWGYSGTYSFSAWDMTSEIHKRLNSYYPDNFTLQTRSQGSSSITGYVKNTAGHGIARCHIALMNGTTYYDQAITDSTGKYTIDKIPNATYNVVATKGPLTFAPSSLSLPVSTASIATDIIGTDPNATTISGVVTNSSNVGVQNIVVSLLGATNYTTATDVNGSYSLNPSAGTYTLTFNKANYTFSGNNLAITVAAGNTLTKNSTAIYSGSYYTLSGNIKKVDGTSNFDGVSVTLSGGKSATTATDVSGNYSFYNLEQNLSYTVAPFISGSLFTPQTVSNLSGNSSLNFTAQAATCVSGKILLGGSPLTGITLKISNRADSVITDASGNYVTPVLTNGSNYMITPHKDGYVFEPAYKYYSSINQAESFDFTAKAVTGTPKKKIVYYYPEWATYARNFQVKDVDTRYLTNLLFAFVMPFYVDGTKSIDDNIPYRSGKNGKAISVENITVNGVAKSVGLAIVDDFADIQKFPTGGIDVETGTGTGGAYVSTCAEWLAAPYKAKGALGQMVQLRKKVKNETARDIQIQISVGGWTLAQAFPSIADNQIASDAFGRACKTFLDKSTYDGIDIDWEFPVDGGTDGTESIDGNTVPVQPHTANDPTNFTRLMKSIRTAIGPSKLLTMACAQNPTNMLDKYVFPGTMAKFGTPDNCLDYLDYIQTMSYDYGGYWCEVATHECPLYNSKNTGDENRNMSVSMLIDTLLSKNGGNIPANKIVMGLPFYGKIFGGIADGGTHGLYQPNPKPGAMLGSWDSGTTPANEASSSIDFGDLKDGKASTKHQYLNLPSSGFTEYWDDIVKCPYLYNPTSKIFVTYDDANSLSEKVKFLNSRYLLGGMVWEVTQDAGDGILMKAVYNNIQMAKLKIDGAIVDNTGGGISGVTVTISGGASLSVTTGADGKFSFIDLEPGLTYNIAVVKSGMAFFGSAYSFSSLQESKVLNIIGSTSSYTMSGKLTLSNGSMLLPGASVALYKGTDLIKTITSTDGNYSFTNVPGGFSYTLKASCAGYACSTGDITLTNLSSNLIQDFKFVMNQYKISGYIYNGSNVGVSGVTVNLTGSVTTALTTDNTGYFESDLLNGVGNYTVTPLRSAAVFTPASYSYTSLTKNESCNFILTEETMLYGYVKDGTTPIANVLVRITPSWDGSGTQWDNWTYCGQRTNAEGYYEFRNGPTNVATLSIGCNNEWDKLSYNFSPLGTTSWTNFKGSHRLDWNTNASLITFFGNTRTFAGSVHVYPCPFQNSFIVELDGQINTSRINVNIYSGLGQLVYSNSIIVENSKAVVQVGSDIPSGMYLLEVQYGNSKFTNRLLKK